MTGKEAGKIALFIGIFIVALTMLTYCLRTNGSVKDRFVGFYAEPKNSIDVIMIGSSSVFPYYSAPQMFGEEGIVCYPLSTNLQRPVAQIYLAKEALSRQTPKLLVFELRMYTGREMDMTHNSAYTRGVIDNLRYSKNRLDAISGMINEVMKENSLDGDDKRYTYWFDIFKYHGNWRSLRLLSQWKTFRYSVPDPLKGFDGASEVVACELTDYSSLTRTEPIEDIQEKALRDLISFLKEKGQEALFVISPYMVNEETAAKINYMEELVTEEGFRFLNLNHACDEMGLSAAEDFADEGNHVNVVGAEKVTKYFETFLKENYDLADHRGEEKYASYQQAYETWCDYYQEESDTVRRNLAKE